MKDRPGPMPLDAATDCWLVMLPHLVAGLLSPRRAADPQTQGGSRGEKRVISPVRDMAPVKGLVNAGV